jgi:hypothetical protein
MMENENKQIAARDAEMTEELRKEARKNALEAKAHYENTCR